MYGKQTILAFGMVRFAPRENSPMSYQLTHSAEVHTHKLIEGRPLYEFINQGMEELTLKIVIFPYLDIPSDVGLRQLVEYLREGRARYLSEGNGRSLGLFLLTKITEDVPRFETTGRGGPGRIDATLLFQRQRN